MSKKTPPKFHSNMSYKTWTNKLEMWQKVTTLLKPEHGIVVLLEALDGNVKAEKAVENITAHDIFFKKSGKFKSRPNKNSTKQSNVNKSNPLYKNEKISRCIICDSKMRWAGKCPHRNESVSMFEAEDSQSENSDSEEVNIVLLLDSDLTNNILWQKLQN